MVFSKRGQFATAFIILGLIILMLVAFFFFTRGKVISPIAEKQLPQVTEEIPIDSAPVKSFVEQCLEKVSAEAIIELGRHGGYIDPTPEGMRKYAGGGNFRLDTAGIDPTSYDALTFSQSSDSTNPLGGWFIPYWHQVSSRNKAQEGITFKKQIPSLEGGSGTVTFQINRYVEEKLPLCLDDFKSFSSLGIKVTPNGGITAETFLTENDVVIALTYPLKMEKAGSAFELSQFRVSHQLALKKLFEFAYYTADTIVRGGAFEKVIKELISLNAGLDNELPPISESELSYSKRFWLESNIKTKLQELFQVNFPKVAVEGTHGFISGASSRDDYLSQDRIRQGIYRYLTLAFPAEINGKPMPRNIADYDVEFVYMPGWPIYFDIIKGEILSASFSMDSISHLFFNLLPVNQYTAAYDVSAPILVQVTDVNAKIKDPYSQSNKEYSFFFALEANVRDNEILTEDYDSTGTAGGGAESIFCNPNRRNSGEIMIEVVDAAGRPVENAYISFSSGEECFIGTTKIEAGKSAVKERFPVAFGEVIVNKEGYLPARMKLMAQLGKEASKKMVILPLVEKKVSVKKITYEKKAAPASTVRSLETKAKELWALDFAPKYLDSDEQVILSFERMGEDSQYASAAVVNGREKSTVLLAPGKYKVTATAMKNKRMIIPKCSGCVCVEYNLLGGCSDTDDLAEVDFGDSFFEGSIEYEVDITQQMLESNKDLVFFTMTMNLAGVPEERQRITDYAGLVKERMITDIEIYEIMKDDAANHPYLRDRFKPAQE